MTKMPPQFQNKRQHRDGQNDATCLYRVNVGDATQVQVFVSSFPVAADVEVDGVFCGSAGEPITVPCGKRRICVSLPGYGRWEKVMYFRPGSDTRLHAQLNKSPDFRIINE